MNVHINLVGECFKQGYAVLEKRAPLVTLVSLDNSYYKQENIHNLLNLAGSLASKVYIFTAPNKYTYLGIGYSPQEAERRSRLKQNTLRNHSKIFIDKVDDTMRFEFVEWTSVEGKAAYQNNRKYIYELYEKNIDFRNEVRETTHAVLYGKLKEGITIESALDNGVHYLLEELAFLTVAHLVFDVENIGVVYHRRWPVLENLLNGKYDNIVNKNVGYVIIST